MTPISPQAASHPDGLKLAREFVIQHGWNATSYQILNPGMQHWFSSQHPAVIGCNRCGSVLLVAGAPVCAEEHLPAVCREFEAGARRQHCSVCYVCAEERLRAILTRSSPHATVALGAQPFWNPLAWPATLQSRASLRAQLRRAANKGLQVETMDAAQAANDGQLRTILQEWIRGRSLPDASFSRRAQCPRRGHDRPYRDGGAPP